MFSDNCKAIANTAEGKIKILKENPLGYFLMAMMAGMFIGFGVLLAFSIGGMLDGEPYAKVVMGIAFTVALSLVVMSGGELFTGSNMVMAQGVLGRTVSLGGTVKIWIVCFIGNWVGAILLAVIFWLTGLTDGPIGAFMASCTATKMSLPFVQLLMRAILCNMLVCLAVWCSFKMKSESGKLIMIFWCLFAFVTTGFEHSVANMTLLTIGMLNPMGQDISMAGYFYNILVAGVGNIIGGAIFVALPYYLASKKNH